VPLRARASAGLAVREAENGRAVAVFDVSTKRDTLGLVALDLARLYLRLATMLEVAAELCILER